MKKKTFWERVEKSDDCWVWQGATRGGYGRVLVDGKLLSAHRVSYEEVNGPVPIGMKVLHKCDNPPCVRPDHLFVGTQKVNVDDAVQKRRHKNPRMPGASNPNARVTLEEVARLRANPPSPSEKPRKAKELGISVRTLNKILRGDRWKESR